MTTSSRAFRRHSILLPRRFNDGSAVPYEIIGDTLIELRQRFGAVSSETQTIQGSWTHEETIYLDELIRVWVDVDDTDANRAFFADFKDRLKARFQQLDIWMTTYLVEVI
ncbi:MAG: hypothetical protein WD042_02900 [Phycisphaeraceae bacterium]